MFIFNPNYTHAQCNESLTRLARLKKAADRVYRYYEWLSSDYKNTTEGTAHSAELVGLRQDVKTALFLSDEQDALVNYFIACVLFAIFVSYQDGAVPGTPCPLDRSSLEGMYDAQAVSVQLTDANYQLISYATGSFLLEGNADPSSLSTMELARKGSLVMADQELTETINLLTLLMAEPEEDLDEVEQGEVFLRELHRLENESQAVVQDVSRQSSDK